MKYQEKKYKVDSFAPILQFLNQKGAKKGEEIVTTHFYTPQPNNDVVKLVQFSDKNEIHVLKETNGKYSLIDRIPVPDTKAGLQWLKNHGYKNVSIVTMAYTDCEYKNGIIGLYLINDSLLSVILDFPPDQHDKIEKELGLEKAEVISLPYNKYLENIGLLKTITIDTVSSI